MPGATGDPGRYDAWYDTPRGRWIGDREFALLAELLDARPGASLLDLGCGSGYFTRRFTAETGLRVTGADQDPGFLTYARRRSPHIPFVRADAARLPFADGAFDSAIAVTSLCFVADEGRALRELWRVTRRRLVLGLLNRHSLLFLHKGMGRRRGGYAGARWHTRREALAVMAGAGWQRARVAATVVLPVGGVLSRWVEDRLWPRCAVGGFLAVAADK